VRLLHGRHLMLNLIPFNRVEGSGYERPDWDRAADMTRQLNRAGVLTRLRRSAAQEVDGGCGQLRARQGGVVVGRPVPVAVLPAA
jgi:23S rRNA (adenine2503-C2)-methyltransferase